MDQMETSYPTVINATEDYLKSQVAEKEQRIVQLEEHIQKVTQRSYADSADKNRNRGKRTYNRTNRLPTASP